MNLCALIPTCFVVLASLISINDPEAAKELGLGVTQQTLPCNWPYAASSSRSFAS